jgi:hypothetical protein
VAVVEVEAEEEEVNDRGSINLDHEDQAWELGRLCLNGSALPALLHPQRRSSLPPLLSLVTCGYSRS